MGRQYNATPEEAWIKRQLFRFIDSYSGYPKLSFFGTRKILYEQAARYQQYISAEIHSFVDVLAQEFTDMDMSKL